MPRELTATKTTVSALLPYVDRWASLVATIVALVLIAFYLVWPQPPETSTLARTIWTLATSVIANFIPILLTFAGAHFLYGRITLLRAQNAKEETAQQTRAELQGDFTAIERQVRQTTQLVRDWELTGVERVYSATDVPARTLEEMHNTQSLGVLGIGNGWLIDGRHNTRLREMLSAGETKVTILMPDPFCSLIKERYKFDEPLTKKLSQSDLRDRVLFWADMRDQFPRLNIRVYHRYPMVTMTMFDRRLFVSSVLFRSRALDSLTFSFKRVSEGFRLYEAHFQNLCTEGSRAVDADYLQQLRSAEFPESWSAA